MRLWCFFVELAFASFRRRPLFEFLHRAPGTLVRAIGGLFSVSFGSAGMAALTPPCVAQCHAYDGAGHERAREMCFLLYGVSLTVSAIFSRQLMPETPLSRPNLAPLTWLGPVMELVCQQAARE